MWRRRCNELQKAKWPPANSVRFQYMRNCPPAGVSAKPGGRETVRPCGALVVCPWCWARLVAKRTWDVVTAGMTGMDSLFARGRVDPYPYKLILMVGRSIYPDDPETQPTTALDLTTLGLTRTKRAVAKVSVAAAMLSVVSPCKSGWVCSQRVLALVPGDFKVREGTHEVLHPTRRNVAAAVALFARYPRGMMYRDADMAKRLLEVRSGYRLLRFAGAFNKNHKPRAAADGDARLPET